MHSSRRSRRSTRSTSRRRPAEAGFSLVELLVVVAIVGLLIGLVGPAAFRQLQSSRGSTAEAQIAQLRSAVDIYAMDTGRYPPGEVGLRGLVENAGNVAGWNGPYLRDGKLPLDPWGGEYLYAVEDGRVIIRSLGADGREGGDGADADISN